ncbi:magnesium transporter CorA family protein [Streptococcus cameli]
MYYQILETLQPTTKESCLQDSFPFVAVLTPEEWHQEKESFDMPIDLEFHTRHIHGSKAEVNIDAITGSFSIPDRFALSEENEQQFAFILDEKGIVFIDRSTVVSEKITQIIQTKKWKLPSLERFLYDFMESILAKDPVLLEDYHMALNQLEDELLEEHKVQHIHQLNAIKRDFTVLNRHYEQLLDVCQEFYENENEFFKEENLRYFHLLETRINRLQTTLSSLNELIFQNRELYKSQMDMKQNKLMAMLTIVTTCCLPLNILVGWYGMNFHYMPELSQKWAYPLVIVFAISIFTGAIFYFKKKKWL